MFSVHTREGPAAAKARGKRIGRPLLAQASVVDRIVRDRDGDASFDAIARNLTTERVPSPAGRPTWQASTVRRLYNATRKEIAS